MVRKNLKKIQTVRQQNCLKNIVHIVGLKNTMQDPNILLGEVSAINVAILDILQKNACRSRKTVVGASALLNDSNFSATLSPGHTDTKVNYSILVNGTFKASALIDMGSTMNHIDKNFATRHNLKIHLENNEIIMAVTGSRSQSDCYCMASIEMQARCYKQVKLVVLDNLFVDVILGRQFLKQHQNLQINYQGKEPPLQLGFLGCIKTDVKPCIFENLQPNCKLLS